MERMCVRERSTHSHQLEFYLCRSIGTPEHRGAQTYTHPSFQSTLALSYAFLRHTTGNRENEIHSEKAVSISRSLLLYVK